MRIPLMLKAMAVLAVIGGTLVPSAADAGVAMDSGLSIQLAPADTTPPADSSSPPADSSAPADSSTPPDPSSSPPDSSTPPPDSSTPPPDSSTPPPDSSTPPPDSSTPPPDSSTPAPTPTLTPPVPPSTPVPVPTPTVSVPVPPTGGGGSNGTGGFPVPPKVGHHPVPHPPRPHPHKTLRPPTKHKATGPHPKRKPWPVTVTVKVLPALAGVQFRFDNRTLTTNAAGIATYTAEHDFAQHTLQLTNSVITTADSHYEFSRWVGQRDPNDAFTKTVTGLPLRANYAVTAAFGLEQSFLAKLVNQNGAPVDPTRVSSITVKSDTGELIELNPATPTWLDVTRPALRHGALVMLPATYSLQSVIVRGTNVVDSGRQTFRPGPGISFVTQFHNLVISGQDALFGSTRGVAAVITFPDGGKVTVPFDDQHQAILNDVPRGTYQASVKAGHAVVASTQFVASKDKTVVVSVISMPDMAVLGGSGLALAIGLLLVGRLRWRRRLVRRFRRSLDTALLPAPEETALL